MSVYERINIKPKVLVTLSIVASLSLSVSASDLFTVKGYAGSFSKIGFNNSIIDGNTNATNNVTVNTRYPTETFTSAMGQLDGIMDLKSKMQEDLSLVFGLGITAGGLALDSTRYDLDASGKHVNPAGVGFNYIGYWEGWDGHINPTGNNTKGILVHNAYARFESKYINLTVGRYESSMDYYSGYTQGFNLDFNLGYGDTNANPDNLVRLWLFGSWGRAFAYSQWIYDYYLNNDITGTYALGIDVSYGGFSKNGSDIEVGNSFLVKPFVYYSKSFYTAPGIKLQYKVKRDFGGLAFGSTTTFNSMFPMLDKSKLGKYRYGNLVQNGAFTLNLIQTFDFNNYNAGVAIYKNFGNANANIGTSGNPSGIDFWTSTVYEIGQALSNFVSADALSPYIFGGGSYSLASGDFNWSVLGRLTFAPRADEQSVALTLTHKFKNRVGVGLKLEYFSVTTKPGYAVGYNGPLLASKTTSDTQDRSHAFFNVDYSF